MSMHPEAVIAPGHPGKFLEKNYLLPMDLSMNRLAMRMQITTTRISEIVRGKRGITADTALRLSKVLGTTPEFWMQMQSEHDLHCVPQQELEQISEIEPFSVHS